MLPINFLFKIAKSYGLSTQQSEAFVVFFGTSKSNLDKANKLGIGEDALNTRMTEVYKKFGFSGSGPGKSRQLFDLLTTEFVKYLSSNYPSLKPELQLDEQLPEFQADDFTYRGIDEQLSHQNSLEINMLNSSSALYVERPPIESLCYETILQPGALIRIKAPRQMGKTELMAKIIDYAQQQGCQKVYLNLQQPEEAVIRDLDRFLQWFCTNVSRQLQQYAELDNNWDEQMSSNDNCSVYFENFILPQVGGSLILGLDSVDRLFPHTAVAQDFFSMLRAWHEDSRIFDHWKKLRLVVSHSREVYVPHNLNCSPFNVGLPIELPEFTRFQVAELAEKYGHSLNETEMSGLIEMVGGNPGLIVQALKALKKSLEANLAQILAEAATEGGVYSNHLKEIWLKLKDNSALVAANSNTLSDTPAAGHNQ